MLWRHFFWVGPTFVPQSASTLSLWPSDFTASTCASWPIRNPDLTKGRSKRVEVNRTKYRKGRTNAYPKKTVTTFLYYSISSKCSIILGTPANGLILFITLFNWHRRSASSWLVLNLALADLCFVIHAFQIIINKQNSQSRLISNDLPFPALACSYRQGASHFFATISFFSIAGLTFLIFTDFCPFLIHVKSRQVDLLYF